jgi:general nucleoside transport system permease protein
VLLFQGLVFLVVLYSESLYGKFAIFQEKEKSDPSSPAIA